MIDYTHSVICNNLGLFKIAKWLKHEQKKKVTALQAKSGGDKHA